MAAMVDLKMSKKKQNEFMKPQTVCAAEYPWGFRLSFDNEQVKKFPGLQDCKAGQKVMIHAEATITDLDEHATERGENHSVEMQIVKLDLKLPDSGKLNAPKPGSGESRADFLIRCIQTLKHEHPSKTTKACLESCGSSWSQAKKKT